MIRIAAGCEITYDCPQATPMLFVLRVHPSRAGDLIKPDLLACEPKISLASYVDGFGNRCTRAVLPPGRSRIYGRAEVTDSGLPDITAAGAGQLPVHELPDHTLVFLLGSRYCETDRLNSLAWSLFGQTLPGWPRVQAICDYVHRNVAFGYDFARPNKTAADVFLERNGVCRDFAHLAIAFCRCMNVPARYCTGYLGDIGVPSDGAPMDFSAWFEAYLDGGWYTFDARHNKPRIGRILLGCGRDAADVPLSNSFGPNSLAGFRVWTDLIEDGLVQRTM